jgi:hypothetical protein
MFERALQRARQFVAPLDPLGVCAMRPRNATIVGRGLQ